ncbi:MAG: hypothetical protein JST21_14985 [Bacteroidetes bacterium]|nr:hypothetical protein [Bacteroidota bacterium]
MEDTALKMSAISALTTEEKIFAGNHLQTSLVKYKHANRRMIMAVIGSCATFVWITLFSIGMVIDSSVFRNTLTSDFSWYKLSMTLLTYTPSNIALLCLASAFIGGCSSMLVITKISNANSDNETDDAMNTKILNNETPVNAMFQGILVYFAFLAGVFITSSNAILKPTAESYTQAAGIVSMLAFLAGYDPTMFRSLMSLSDKLKGKELQQ